MEGSRGVTCSPTGEEDEHLQEAQRSVRDCTRVTRKPRKTLGWERQDVGGKCGEGDRTYHGGHEAKSKDVEAKKGLVEGLHRGEGGKCSEVQVQPGSEGNGSRRREGECASGQVKGS